MPVTFYTKELNDLLLTASSYATSLKFLRSAGTVFNSFVSNLSTLGVELFESVATVFNLSTFEFRIK